MHVIRYHYLEQRRLDYVWLIPSSDVEVERFGPSSVPVASESQAQCRELEESIRRSTGETRNLEAKIIGGASPANAQDTVDLINRVYRTEARRLGLEAPEIIADFTGGTKPMSVGMIMACLSTESTLQYTAWNADTGQMSGPFVVDYQHSAFDLIG